MADPVASLTQAFSSLTLASEDYFTPAVASCKDVYEVILSDVPDSTLLAMSLVSRVFCEKTGSFIPRPQEVSIQLLRALGGLQAFKRVPKIVLTAEKFHKSRPIIPFESFQKGAVIHGVDPQGFGFFGICYQIAGEKGVERAVLYQNIQEKRAWTSYPSKELTCNIDKFSSCEQAIDRLGRLFRGETVGRVYQFKGAYQEFSSTSRKADITLYNPKK